MKKLFFIGVVCMLACSKPNLRLDIVITNAEVYDGSNVSSYPADVGIIGDRISFIGNSKTYKIIAAHTIDGEGYVLAPGFIDPHTHATRDLESPERNQNLNYLKQGVTTVFIGSDGRSATDLKTQFELFEKQGIGTNVASYIGHATARRLVMGMRNEAPTSEELDNMKTFVRNGMEAGALGLGSGLYYAPANFAQTEEVIELAKIAAEYGGSYDVHMRDESTYNIGLIEAVNETIRIAEEANLHANIAHIKCLGVDVWNKSDEVIDIINEARKRGLNITADQYPYNASGTSVSGALIPRWYLADRSDSGKQNSDPDNAGRLLNDIRENLRKRGGPASLLLTSPSEENASFKGMTLEQVAIEWKISPAETALRLYENGGSSLGSFNMQQKDIINFMQQPWVMTSSDGSTGHPRKYGSFPKKLKEYVLEKKALTLENFIYKSSGLTALSFDIEQRGLIKKDYYADLILFKPEEVSDLSTFENPEELAQGMHYVIVNGQVVIEEGENKNVFAGEVLRQ